METSYGKKPLRQSLSNLTGYQKFPYHMVFDVKYDLRHKARIVAGGNWTVDDKEDIYSGVVRLDTVRIEFF
jgi:hypothetical protein